MKEAKPTRILQQPSPSARLKHEPPDTDLSSLDTTDAFIFGAATYPPTTDAVRHDIRSQEEEEEEGWRFLYDHPTNVTPAPTSGHGSSLTPCKDLYLHPPFLFPDGPQQYPDIDSLIDPALLGIRQPRPWDSHTYTHREDSNAATAATESQPLPEQASQARSGDRHRYHEIPMNINPAAAFLQLHDFARHKKHPGSSGSSSNASLSRSPLYQPTVTSIVKTETPTPSYISQPCHHEPSRSSLSVREEHNINYPPSHDQYKPSNTCTSTYPLPPNFHPTYPHTHTVHFPLCGHTVTNHIHLPHRRPRVKLCICPNIPTVLPKLSRTVDTNLTGREEIKMKITGAELQLELDPTRACDTCQENAKRKRRVRYPV
ncbi:hypothetical protein H072_2206 [Dactylellina haptotyla CBS 200.50]|uniref:Uncharacterized protein n=1 Tax=Dactylellina haptotyla (strain CBS 200.50) TaxID=1284197 RepID=S8ALI6_DACHA|nr:hypothetical protein H072_2206 [Dactylellina haptotyla CBS 200.50]